LGLIKGVDSYCFHLSPTITHDATQSSVRQYFAGFAVIAAQNPTYEEQEVIGEARPRAAQQPGYVNSMRASPYRMRAGVSVIFNVPISMTTPDTIIVGHTGVAAGAVNCVRRFSPARLSGSKAVFEVEAGTTQFIAKFPSYGRLLVIFCVTHTIDSEDSIEHIRGGRARMIRCVTHGQKVTADVHCQVMMYLTCLGILPAVV
jgi:hypothetical protein